MEERRAPQGRAASLRLFVALEPPEAVRRWLGELQAQLRADARGAEVRWLAPEGVHLTLQFLGAVAQEQVDEVKRAVAAAARSGRPLALAASGAGAFPGPRRARVVWAGVDGEVEALEALVAELGRALAPLGFPPEERRFRAHLTIGRARDPKGARGLEGALAKAHPAPLPWTAEEVLLFRSHLSPAGARYEALARARLGESASG